MPNPCHREEKRLLPGLEAENPPRVSGSSLSLRPPVCASLERIAPAPGPICSAAWGGSLQRRCLWTRTTAWSPSHRPRTTLIVRTGSMRFASEGHARSDGRIQGGTRPGRDVVSCVTRRALGGRWRTTLFPCPVPACKLVSHEAEAFRPVGMSPITRLVSLEFRGQKIGDVPQERSRPDQGHRRLFLESSPPLHEPIDDLLRPGKLSTGHGGHPFKRRGRDSNPRSSF